MAVGRTYAPRRESTATEAPARRATTGSFADAVLDLQRDAGNQAVAGLVASIQRKGGWKGASTEGEAWNASTHDTVGGAIRRIPIQGLTLGNQGAYTGGFSAELTDESAAGRAIVLAPASLNPDQPIDCMLHFHGYAEKKGRPYAGYRQRKSDNSVRDLALDHLEQQLAAAGSAQLIGVLAQGGDQSQFGNASFDADAYLDQVITRLMAEGELKKPKAKDRPDRGRTMISGHSGGGHVIRAMLEGSGTAKLPANLGELVLFDAINNPKESKAIKKWVLSQLDTDKAGVTDAGTSDADKRRFLEATPTLRGYFSTVYAARYAELQTVIDNWFSTNEAALGAFAGDVRAKFQLIPAGVGGEHEAVLRGHRLGDESNAGEGNVTDAIRAFYKPTVRAAAAPTSTPTRPKRSRRRGKGSKGSTGSGSAGSGSTGSTGTAASTPTPVAAEPGASPRPAAPSRDEGASGAATARVLDGSSGWDAAIAVLAAMGSLPTEAAAFLVEVATGSDPLRAAVAHLGALGISETDITDLIFGFAHPELGGGRIPADATDLKKDWLALRRRIVRPALAGGPPTGARPAADKPATKAAKTVGVAGKGPVTVTPTASSMSADKRAKLIETALTQAKTGGAAEDVAAVASDLKKSGTNADDWFADMVPDATFLGIPIKASGSSKAPGVHKEMLAALQQGEQALMAKYPGKSADQVAKALGVYSLVGLRRPKKATGGSRPSMHCFGMAVDMNYAGNPFVGNQGSAAVDMIKHATLLMSGSAVNIKAAPRKLAKAERGDDQVGRHARAVRAGEQWESHHSASEALRAYLNLSDTELAARVQAGGGGGHDLAWWQASLAADRRASRRGDFGEHTDPAKAGFMDLAKELVIALEEAGLSWGGSYNTAKDLMHFDRRGGTIVGREQA